MEAAQEYFFDHMMSTLPSAWADLGAGGKFNLGGRCGHQRPGLTAWTASGGDGAYTTSVPYLCFFLFSKSIGLICQHQFEGFQSYRRRRAAVGMGSSLTPWRLCSK